MSAPTPDALVPLIVANSFELAGRFRRHGEKLAADAGQTQSRWQVLSAASAEPKTVAQIARRLGVTRQNVQRLADRLVAERLASYAANPDHRASPHLVLTARGRSALAAIEAGARDYHARLAALVGERDIRAAHRALRTLLAALDEVGSAHFGKDD